MEQELRKFIWNIYQEYFKKTGETCDKRFECRLNVIYPSISEAEFDEDKFMAPIAIKFYSYELGPSREHFFYKKGTELNEPDYNEFICEDLIEGFKNIVREWLDRVLKNIEANVWR